MPEGVGGPDPAQVEKSKGMRFGMQELEVCLVLLVALAQIGLPIIGVQQNFALGVSVWGVFALILIHIIWRWETSRRLGTLGRSASSVLILALLTSILCKPLAREWYREHGSTSLAQSRTPGPAPSSSVSGLTQRPLDSFELNDLIITAIPFCNCGRGWYIPPLNSPVVIGPDGPDPRLRYFEQLRASLWFLFDNGRDVQEPPAKDPYEVSLAISAALQYYTVEQIEWIESDKDGLDVTIGTEHRGFSTYGDHPPSETRYSGLSLIRAASENRLFLHNRQAWEFKGLKVPAGTGITLLNGKFIKPANKGDLSYSSTFEMSIRGVYRFKVSIGEIPGHPGAPEGYPIDAERFPQTDTRKFDVRMQFACVRKAGGDEVLQGKYQDWAKALIDGLKRRMF